MMAVKACRWANWGCSSCIPRQTSPWFSKAFYAILLTLFIYQMFLLGKLVGSFVTEMKEKIDTEGEITNSDSSSPLNWCIFVRSQFFGEHSPNRQAASLNWFHDVTLPSIISSYSRWQSSSLRATSGVSLSVHYMLSARDTYSNYSFPPFLARSFAEHGIQLAVLPAVKNVVNNVDDIERYMISAVKSSGCLLVSAGRIDGDDMLDSYFLEIVRGILAFTDNHLANLDTAVMHGTKSTRKVYWSSHGCQYTQYNTTYALSLGMTITLPRRGFSGSDLARTVYEVSHTHVMETIRKKVTALKTPEECKGGECWIPSREPHFLPMSLDTSVYTVTVLSSHWEQYKDIGELKNCTFLLERNKVSPDGILSKEIFDVLNAAKAPTLTDSEMHENNFIKTKNATTMISAPLLLK